MEQSLKSVQYNNIAGQVHPFIKTMHLVDYCIYVQNNTICHAFQIVREEFQEHSNEFQVMSWRPNSPDMN